MKAKQKSEDQKIEENQGEGWVIAAILWVVLLLLLVVFPSCTTISVPYTFTNEFSAAEQYHVVKALQELPKGSTAPKHVIFSKFDSRFEYGLACVGCDPCWIRLNRSLTARYFKVVLWHEYGHCVGLEHLSEGVMAPAVRPTNDYSAEEVKAFKELLR
jgi:hypothetical protein